jgi:UDP-N-acetylglucosamine:LPS N-acetylglucosamine transferase
LAYKIDTLLADHGRFSRMQEAARRMARPDAASEVVSTVLKAKV